MIGRRVVVHVTRTGGIAGLRKEWTVKVDDSLLEQLVENPPRQTPPEHVHDDFQWIVSTESFSYFIPNSNLDGPWRQVVDQASRAGRAGRKLPPADDGPYAPTS